MTTMKRLVISACVAMALLAPVAWVWFDNFYDGVVTLDAVELDIDANEDDSEDDAAAASLPPHPTNAGCGLRVRI